MTDLALNEPVRGQDDDPRSGRTNGNAGGKSESIAVDRDLRFGVAIFDDGSPGPGWACEGGRTRVREESFRFETPAELGNMTVWLTNAEFNPFREAGLTTSGFFRRDDYLKVKMPEALAEWGLDESNPVQTTALLAECFGRVMGHAVSAFERALSNASWRRRRNLHGSLPSPAELRGEAMRMISSQTLILDLAGLVHQVEDYPSDMIRALEGSRQMWTRTSFTSPRSKVEILLRRPRLSYAISMLRQSYPVGPWEYVKADLLQGGSALEKLAALQATGRPAFVSLSSPSGIEVEALQVFGFSQGARDSTNKPTRRDWAPLPEAIELATLSEIVVNGAWIGKGFEKIDGILAPGMIDALDHPTFHASWSAGVFGECLWLAACKSMKKGDRWVPDNKRPPSPRDVWMRMQDRMAMYRDAIRLHEMGYTVINYSIGAVRVSVGSNEISDLVRDAYRIGLTPQLSTLFGLEGQEVPSPADWGGDRRGMQEAWIRSVAVVDKDLARFSLWEIDGLGEFDGEKAASRVAEIGEAVVERVYGSLGETDEENEGGSEGDGIASGQAPGAAPAAVAPGAPHSGLSVDGPYMGGMPDIDLSFLGVKAGEEVLVTRRRFDRAGRALGAESRLVRAAEE